jgi:hypothetical protein
MTRNREELLGVLHEHLDHAGFAEALAESAALTLDEAIALALGSEP